MNKEKYFIDLSKCSKEQIKALPQKFEKAGHKILSETLSDLISGKITDGFKFLFYSPGGWNQNDYPLNGRTEITYPEFIKLFEDGEKGKTQLSFETEYHLEEFRRIQSEYFDENGKCYTGIHLSTNIMEQMLSLINQLETELNSNQ